MKRWLLTGAAAAVVMIGFDAIRFQTQINSSTTRAGQLEQQVHEHEQLEQTRDRLMKAISAMREIDVKIARRCGAQLDVLATMRELSRLTPETVKLTSFTLQRAEGRLVGRLNGYAVEAEEAGQMEIDSFIRRLDDSPLFDRLVLGKVEMGIHRGRKGNRFDATFIAVEAPGVALAQGGEEQ